MLTWPNARRRPRETRSASMPSCRSWSMTRKRLRLSSTGEGLRRSRRGISEAKMSVPPITSSTTAHQYGA